MADLDELVAKFHVVVTKPTEHETVTNRHARHVHAEQVWRDPGHDETRFDDTPILEIMFERDSETLSCTVVGLPDSVGCRFASRVVPRALAIEHSGKSL